MSPERVTAGSPADDISVELSMRRTGMSFQRTRMSADRTLMSVIRTSLSLISFGFTIYQFFQKVREASDTAGSAGARNFGVTLVWLGVGMLIVGILYHVQFMRGLRAERMGMKDAGLVHAESSYPVSMTLITALILLLIGIVAILSITFKAGPFGP
jgi:putative membrane protein